MSEFSIMSKKIGFFFFFLALFVSLYSQQVSSIEFRDQSIQDILMVLADISKTSIIPDETVTGKASFYFSDSSIDEALQKFLPQYKLYQIKINNVIYVSRIYTEYFESTNSLTLKAEDVPIENVLKSVSKSLGKTILYDVLPEQTVTIDATKLSVDRVLEIITKKLFNYSIETAEDYYYIKNNAQSTQAAVTGTSSYIKKEGDLYSSSIDKAPFLDVVTELFKKAEKEYVLLVRANSTIEHFYFANKDFSSFLPLLLEQGNADYKIINNIYYLIEIQRNDTLKKVYSFEVIPLTYLSASEITNLIPSELTSGLQIKTDKASNALILSGTNEQLQPLIQFISLLDTPNTKTQYRRFDTKYLKTEDVLSLIPESLIPSKPVRISGSNSFIATGTAETLESLENFISLIDKKDSGSPVWLNYISNADLMKTLPPSIAKEEVVDSGFPNLIFFTGSNEKKSQFLKELSLIDRPKPQITYQLLVIQYSKGHSLTLNNKYDVKKVAEQETNVFTLLGKFDQIVNLGFDVIAKFGYQFALNLNSQLGENTANIFADTTLNGISGQAVKFQNTDTYRYQEAEYDDDTKKVTNTGTTKEITSGLIIDLNGWVSGDDMITVSVNATVSKRNSDKGTSNQVPSTSERVVNTQVRTPSGEPIIISGLIKEDTSKNEEKFPILGSIPLLGNLFKDSSRSSEKTEIVIYIVPHLKRDKASYFDTSLTLEKYYKSFVSGNQ